MVSSLKIVFLFVRLCVLAHVAHVLNLLLCPCLNSLHYFDQSVCCNFLAAIILPEVIIDFVLTFPSLIVPLMLIHNMCHRALQQKEMNNHTRIYTSMENFSSRCNSPVGKLLSPLWKTFFVSAVNGLFLKLIYHRAGTSATKILHGCVNSVCACAVDGCTRERTQQKLF